MAPRAVLVGEGALRRDLYFRLAVIPIEVPPLRTRIEDIQMLAQHPRRKCRLIPRQVAAECPGKRPFRPVVYPPQNIRQFLFVHLYEFIEMSHPRQNCPVNRDLTGFEKPVRSLFTTSLLCYHMRMATPLS